VENFENKAGEVSCWDKTNPLYIYERIMVD
jgi:hypothetical protein